MQQGKLPRQYVLNYYGNENKRRLKGTIPLDECEQVSSDFYYIIIRISGKLPDLISNLLFARLLYSTLIYIG